MNYALGLDDDVLANPKQCALDAPLMKTLLVNTIRVYTVDSTKNHTECMNILEQNGLYVILGLSTPNSTIEAVRQLLYHLAFALCKLVCIADES